MRGTGAGLRVEAPVVEGSVVLVEVGQYSDGRSVKARPERTHAWRAEAGAEPARSHFRLCGSM